MGKVLADEIAALAATATIGALVAAAALASACTTRAEVGVNDAPEALVERTLMPVVARQPIISPRRLASLPAD